MSPSIINLHPHQSGGQLRQNFSRFQAEGRLAVAPWGWETPWSSDTAVITAFQGNLVKNP